MRNLSNSALASLNAQDTSEAYLVLLEIDAGEVDPYRFTSDAVNTVVGLDTYESFPFDITLPKSVDGKVSTAQLSVTNVDRRLVDAIRTLTVPMTVNIKVVLGSDPTDIMMQYQDFTWRQLTYDAATVTGTLTLEDFLNEPVGHIMGSSNFPGLFYQ